MQSNPRERLLHYADLLQGTLFGKLEAETGAFAAGTVACGRVGDDSTESATPVCTWLVGAAGQRPAGARLLFHSQVRVRFRDHTPVAAASAYRPAAALFMRLDECTPDSA